MVAAFSYDLAPNAPSLYVYSCNCPEIVIAFFHSRSQRSIRHTFPHTISTNKPLPHSLTLLVFLDLLFLREDKYPHNRKAPALDAFSTVHCFNYMYLLTSQNLFSALCGLFLFTG